jgi:5'(3')-deoxyribonucleotidase
MSKKIRLLLDCDGVLSDFVGGAVRLYNTLTGRRIDPDSIKEWNFTGALEFETKAQKERYDKALRAPGFAMSLDPLPGSKEAVKKLCERVSVHIVTSPLSGSVTWAHEREVWLDLHYGIPHSRVHHSQTKYVLSGDLFVDDKPENVQEWAYYNPLGTAFLWDTSGNRQDKELERLRSWDELLERIGGRRTS